MVNSKFIAAADRYVVPQRMQSQTADQLIGQRLNSISFAIEYFYQFAPRLLIVPQPNHPFFFGQGCKDGTVETDIQRVDLPVVEPSVHELQHISLDHFAAAFDLLPL